MPINTTALRAVCWSLLYGADKIPDSWFDKIPGGYYRRKRKEEKARDARRSRRDSKSSRKHASRSPSADSYESDEGEHRSHSDRRVSYDGGDDSHDDDYNEIYDRDRSGRSRRRSPGVERVRLDGSKDEGIDGREEYYTGRHQPSALHNGRYVPAGVSAGATAAAAVTTAAFRGDHARPASSGPVHAYVPYADIYAPQPQQPYQPRFAAAQSNDFIPYSRTRSYTPAHNQQQPAQLSPFSQAPAAYARSRRGRDKDQYSESHRSYESDEDQTRYRKRDDRARSRQRQKSRTGSRNRARSSLRSRFDISEKGIGYGAVGAVAGGLVGNEVGRGGVLPIITGAVIGGLGANAFETMEKQKKSRRDGRDANRSTKRSTRNYDYSSD